MAEQSLTVEELQKVLRVFLKKTNDKEATDFEEASEARDCVREKDIQRIIDLGLGRGVDATDPTPWKNKTSFQVRPVTIENIIGTEEGGGEQSYDREIINASETRGQVSASITDPKATVSIGVEGEYAHSSSNRYKVIGTKVLNRTISFKSHCNDSDIQLPPGSDTFETWLCKWILKNMEEVIYDDPYEEHLPDAEVHVEDKIIANDGISKSESHDYENVAAMKRGLPARVKPLPRKRRTPRKLLPSRETVIQKVERHMIESKIVESCNKFISQFKVTHYVSSIQLGASGYEVITESKRGRRLGVGSHIGVQKIAAGSATGSHSKSHHKKTTDARKIGVIELKDNIAMVKRGSHHEAVVGIQVRPISDLITSRKLKEIMQRALVRYTESKGDTSAGPFLIRCVTNNLYLNVVGVNNVKATPNVSSASEFYLKPSGNPMHPEEFYICYFSSKHTEHDQQMFSDDVTTMHDAKRVPQYLQTPVSIFGSNPGPLEFGYHVRDRDTRLVLQSSVRKHHQPPVSLSAWMSGNEICFIQCARRRKNGYVAVKQSEYSTFTCCVPSKRDSSVSTLFQLVQKWEARVDNLMKPQVPLHEDAYGIVAMRQSRIPKKSLPPPKPLKLNDFRVEFEEDASDSGDAEKSESEENEENSEEIPHETREHPIARQKDILKEHLTEELS